MKQEDMKAGTGGLGDGLDTGNPLSAPQRGPVQPLRAPHSVSMFPPMHGSREPPGNDDIEDRASGTETLEAVLAEVVREGDPVAASMYASELVRRIRAHGYESPDHRAMTEAVQRRARRLGIPPKNLDAIGGLWEPILCAAAREVGLHHVRGETLSFVDAIALAEPACKPSPP